MGRCDGYHSMIVIGSRRGTTLSPSTWSRERCTCGRSKLQCARVPPLSPRLHDGSLAASAETQRATVLCVLRPSSTTAGREAGLRNAAFSISSTVKHACTHARSRGRCTCGRSSRWSPRTRAFPVLPRPPSHTVDAPGQRLSGRSGRAVARADAALSFTSRGRAARPLSRAGCANPARRVASPISPC